MKKGDILVSLWGYEQTNVSFYEIVKLTEKMVTVVELDNRIESGGHYHYQAMPVPGSGKGEAIRRRIVYNGPVPGCRINDCIYARLWDGSPQYGTSYA